MGDISQHFNRSEFACKGKDCCYNSSPISMRLVQALEELRSITQLYHSTINPALQVTSGFRCRKHNSQVSKTGLDGLHTLGLAADIVIPEGLSVKAMADLAICIPDFYNGAIITYGKDRIIHLDIRGSINLPRVLKDYGSLAAMTPGGNHVSTTTT